MHYKLGLYFADFACQTIHTVSYCYLIGPFHLACFLLLIRFLDGVFWWVYSSLHVASWVTPANNLDYRQPQFIWVKAAYLAISDGGNGGHMLRIDMAPVAIHVFIASAQVVPANDDVMSEASVICQQSQEWFGVVTVRTATGKL